MLLPAAQKLVLVAVISVYIFYYSKCAASAVAKGGDGDSKIEPLISKSSISVNVDSKAASTTKGAVNEKFNSQGNKGPSQETRFLLAKDPACAEDVMRLCDKSLHHNNFAVLDCVQDYKKTEESDISPDCHHLLWTYKRNLTKDDRFVEAGKTVCGSDINRFPDCIPLGDKPGHLLSCLMDYQENITNPQCKQFLTKMESIVFSDYRLIYQFADHCENDIRKFKCGRMDNSDNSPHSQGDTIECLSKNPKELSPECQHEILRIAEIQSEDFHLDRPLFFACRDDRERFCENVPAGDGKVYRCLLHHKMHKDMSHECRDKLTRRQKLVSLDYKASKGLVKACREDIRAHRCREETSKNREIRLAQILMCLENALHKGFPVDGECQAEMLDHRRGLMEDFQLSPSVVHACENDIAKFCNEKLEGNGRTIHCLMEHARPTTRKKKRITEECKRELEVLVHETDAGEDWRVDPLLRESCQSVVDVACKGLRAGDGRVMSCLMDKVGSAQMTEECEDKLLQIQYFVARDFRLDPKLYQSCREDAKVFCNAGDNWADDPNKMGPHRGPLLPCLFRYARHPMDSLRMSTACIQQVKRVMRQRASNVDLHPEIEMACINDLADRCLEKVNKGEEIVCLQDNLESLDSDCQEAIRNYTEEEAENIELNRVVYKACEPILKMYCEDLIGDNVGQADMMECLVLHKNSYKMSKYEKCHAAVEHFQLISLKDYRFTFKFKNACKRDVVDFCKNVRTKAEVVTCLSELVRNDTLNENPPRVSKECRQQLRVELLQRNEDIELDPGLNEACNLDRQKFCNDILPGNAQVIECLKDHQKALSDKCHLKIFNRQQEEMLDNSVDYTLVSVCKNMIKKYCDDHNPIDSLSCLKANKQDRNFDPKCRSIVLKRMAQQNEDYRLNPRLRNACSSEVKKFCHDIVYNKSGKDSTYEGKVIACLKEQFLARRLRVSCEDEISRIIKDTQLDYRQDPILAEACKVEIALHCSGSDLLDSDGRGLVEECLKIHFQKHDFKNNECRKHVARLIQEGSTDVHLDPLLFKACALDLSHYCSNIPAGQGKQMKCLLDVAKSQSGMQDLQKECKTTLNQRVEMYNYAMKVAPENVQDIVDQVVVSPARNYFIVVGLAILGIIFMSGLFCGRITKRVHYEMKRK